MCSFNEFFKKSSKKYYLKDIFQNVQLYISSKKFLHGFNKHVSPFLILHYEAVKRLDESIFIELLLPLTVP